MKTKSLPDLIERPADVAKEVCAAYGVPLDTIRSRANTRLVSHARKAVALALRTRTLMSLQEIGDYLGGRDCSTILYLIGSSIPAKRA